MYTYQSKYVLSQGDIVIVPFGKKKIIGIVLEKSNYSGDIKEIDHYTSYNISEFNLKFLKLSAIETIISIEKIIKLMLPSYIVKKLPEFKIYKIYLDKILNLKASSQNDNIKKHIGEIQCLDFKYEKLKCDKKDKKNTQNSAKMTQNSAKMTQNNMKNTTQSDKIISEEVQSINNKTQSQYITSLDLKKSIIKKTLELEAIEEVFENININKIIKTTHRKQSIEIDLSEEQKTALDQIVCSTKPVLFQGVTGSGKTEVYFNAIDKIISAQGQCLILLPEIQLASDIYKRFCDYFDVKSVVLAHSGTKKYQLWHDIITGKTKYIVGTRSAIFFPFKNLELIIMDEEHDKHSFNQEHSTTYNAFNIVNILAKAHNAKLIFVSATPSIESIWHAKYLKSFDFVELKSRYHNVSMPKIKIIEKKSKNWIENETRMKIIENIKNENQVFLFLNKKGYSPIFLCKKCNIKITCENCTSSMTFYKAEKLLKCCYCKKSSLPRCNICLSEELIPCGPGTERIIEELKTFIPVEHKIIEFTNDIEDKDEVVNKIKNYEYSIIVGTQILAKGYTFPKLQFVCIIDADSSMYSSDIYSFEITHQLFTQIIGRSGRIVKGGEVFIQTRHPDSAFIKSILSQNIDEFIKNEIDIRKKTNMPPFSKAILIQIENHNDNILKQYCYDIYLTKNSYFFSNIEVIGPTQDKIYKKNNVYRMQFLIKSGVSNKIENISIIKWIKSSKLYKKVKIRTVVNPASL